MGNEFTNEQLVQLAVDTYANGHAGKFSADQSLDVLRQELIARNGGSAKLDRKALRRGMVTGLFDLVETIVDKTINIGLRGDEFFMNMVDYRDIANGDKNEFYIPDTSLFIVSEVSAGNQAARRQRISSGTTTAITTTWKMVKIYEELDRVLSGQIDFNELIDRVGLSFTRQIRDDAYSALTSISKASGDTYYPTAGTYSEGALLTMIEHVEAATGKKATLYGTKSALKNCTMTALADSAKEDQYNLGYMGKFYGTPCLCVPQVHTAGTDTFKLSDKEIYVIASDDKPIKCVTEGEAIIDLGSAFKNADLSQEYVCGKQWGTGLIVAEKFGVYTLS